MPDKRILISGAGIAGLTLAIELKRRGFDPLLIEREAGLRAEGYMMDFFGSGWDVAQRMALVPALEAVRYPIDIMEFVDGKGRPFVHMPISRMRRALDNKYVYLRRGDLERILAERARAAGVDVRYATSLSGLADRGAQVEARFADNSQQTFDLVIGADGVHSRVRELVFGPQRQFARFLGLYVAAFHVPRGQLPIDREVKLYEEADRMAFLYPLGEQRLDATFVFRHGAVEVPKARRLDFLRECYRGCGWIVEDVIRAHEAGEPVFFDDVTQIVMPQWHKGRVALVGDACGCLTLLAGQGSHMAMAGAYVLAEALARHRDHGEAFAAYENFLKPCVDKRQRDAARFAGMFVPKKTSRPWLRRLSIKLIFNPMLFPRVLKFFGSKSVLAGR